MELPYKEIKLIVKELFFLFCPLGPPILITLVAALVGRKTFGVAKAGEGVDLLRYNIL